jgi:hypothetical protein
MRGIFGCGGMIAAVAFVIGMIVSFFATDVTVGEKLALAVMTAAMAFVAAVLLMYRDHFRHTVARRAVRRMLLARQDMVDRDYSVNSPDSDPTLIAQTRQAVAAFFDVPIEKVSIDDNLREDLNFEALEFGFHTCVVYHVLEVRNSVPRFFTFNADKLVNVRDMASEIGRVIDDFNRPKNREDAEP